MTDQAEQIYCSNMPRSNHGVKLPKLSEKRARAGDEGFPAQDGTC